MLVSPLPGASRESVVDALRDLHTKVSNLQTPPVEGGSYRWLVNYLNWVNEATRMLCTQISAADVDRLVLTKRYELLLSMIARVSPEADTGQIVKSFYPSGEYHPEPAKPHPVVNDLLATELRERTVAFDEAHTSLRRQVERWSQPCLFISMDTTVYIEHPVKLREMDIAEMADVQGFEVRLLVPMLVVEELDGLKRRGDNSARWRAAYTLAVLDEVLQRPAEPAQLRASDALPLWSREVPRGEVSVELLFDIPGHVRLPVNDDEIIDRILVAQSLTGHPVRFITYDTSQAFKARAVGLQVIRLEMPIESDPEPEPRDKTRRKRRDRARGTSDSNVEEDTHDGPREAGRRHSRRADSNNTDHS